MIASIFVPFLDGLTLAIRVFVGLLLLLGVKHKSSRRSEFVAIVRDYQLMPDRMAAIVAHGIVAAEGAIGVALLIWPSSLPAGIAASSLFAVFAIAVTLNLLRGRRDLMCGCDNDGAISWAVVLRNIILGCVVLGGAWYGAERHHGLIDWASATLCGVALLGVYEAAHRLWAIGMPVNSPAGNRRMV